MRAAIAQGPRAKRRARRAPAARHLGGPGPLRRATAVARAFTAGAAIALFAAIAPIARSGAGLAIAAETSRPPPSIEELEHDAASRPALAPILADPIARAKNAIERAIRLRRVGDATHAAQAEALAREWVEQGRDLVRAVDAEAEATDVHRRALDRQGQVDRTRALVDEGLARVGRLEAEIREAGDGGPGSRTAVEVHASDKALGPKGVAGGAANRKTPDAKPTGERMNSPGDNEPVTRAATDGGSPGADASIGEQP